MPSGSPCTLESTPQGDVRKIIYTGLSDVTGVGGLVGFDYDGVRRWLKDDLNDVELLLVPVHLPGHWSLVWLDFGTRTINYADSLYCASNQGTPQPVDQLHKWLKEELVAKEIAEQDPENWTLQSVPCPQQENLCDCGVFACMFAWAIVNNIDVQRIQQRHMSLYRAWLCDQVLHDR